MPLLVMVFVMMKQILLNVIMMVDIVAQILTWLVMPYVMMRLTILDVIMMVETVVWMSTQTPVLTAIVLQVVSSHHLGCPGNYANNLDLTWLIQVQMGQ